MLNKRKESTPYLTEQRIAFLGLCIALLIISIKIIYEERITMKSLNVNPSLDFQSIWDALESYSSIWFPLFCGLMISYFTWMCVYLDSNVPGVSPPSPMSPERYRVQSGHTFHLNYVFAIFMGILTTSYMYINNISM
ncbi:ADP-ribosylation factor-like protein 6-interacting protein 6 [Anthonomus grandis grandis]|uniref:ADP-ribosylation factor-like protein 6-interacting protein 6 n=1 Tax=Anthonomus grandis grandis TaxID=2921223 RepID=UPI0021663A64|nr:ADP-ribosylation factor-like protein 6-interacting protein 6 [Anthonomus grandis grandis]